MMIWSCTSEEKEAENLILDVKSIVTKKKGEVEKETGPSEKSEFLKNKYPCENEECQKATYQKGKIEIIYKNNEVKRITINSVNDLTSDDSAIESLGFEYSKSQFNGNGVRKWSSLDGIDEITFFPEYILIIVKK